MGALYQYSLSIKNSWPRFVKLPRCILQHIRPLPYARPGNAIPHITPPVLHTLLQAPLRTSSSISNPVRCLPTTTQRAPARLLVVLTCPSRRMRISTAIPTTNTTTVTATTTKMSHSRNFNNTSTAPHYWPYMYTHNKVRWTRSVEASRQRKLYGKWKGYRAL